MRLFFALIVISTATVAQDTDRYDLAVPRHAIKFSPGHLLFNRRPTVEFSYEQRIASRWTVQGEYGLIVNIRNTQNDGPTDAGWDGGRQFDHAWESGLKGYKAKLETRYYVHANRSSRFTVYTAGELYYNNIKYQKRMWTRESYDDTKDAVYEKLHRQRVYHEEKGISAKFGFLWNLGPVLVDVNGGLCYRIIHYSKLLPIFEKDEPDFLEFPTDETSREEPGLVVGVRVGYRFPWRRPE